MMPRLIEAGAEFSPDERYRYRLWRRWGEFAPKLYVIGLNSSTADAAKNDPTVTRCIGYAKRWGFDGLEMLNLFAYRATDTRDMLRADDPLGNDNRRILHEQCETAIALGSGLLCAWGALGRHWDQEADFIAMLQRGAIGLDGVMPAACLGLTVMNSPVHPLYQRAEALPFAYVGDGGELVRRRGGILGATHA